MRFRALGPLEVWRVGELVDLGPYKQRSLLALLLIHRNEVVPLARILDELWGEDVSIDRKGALHVYVSNLRSVLEPDRGHRSEGTLLLTRAPGYVLVTHDVDADDFVNRVREGRSLLDTDPAAASMVIGEALSLWHGRAYEEFTYERWAQSEIEHLTEARLAAVESRIQADLDRGMAGELIGELGSLVREHPLREHFSAQLMIALYRSGRQAEALRAYRMLAERLADELAITPSAEVRHLEERMVMADPLLMVVPGERQTIPVAGTRTVRGYELREEIGHNDIAVTYRGYQASAGRQVAVKEINRILADDPEFVHRFDDDARRVSQLRSDHVLPIYDYWREPGAAYVVERLMLGGTLADRLDGAPLSPEQAASMVEDVGEALVVAHRAGIAHSDIRPSNILFDSDGTAYLADFPIGSARHLDPPSAEPGTALRDSFREDEAALAGCVAEALAGREGELPELMVGMDPNVSRVLLCAAGSSADGYRDIRSFTAALLDALDGNERVERTADVVNPYKGLRAFEQADREDFFGRDREIERLIGRVADPSRSGRFVAVVGPSGSGKSSLVKAGLVPALRRGAAPGTSSWFVVEMVPGRYPFEALEDALLAVAFDPPASVLPLLTGEGGIARTVDRVLPGDDSQLLLVIDQLEELFTHTDPSTANLFLANLAASVNVRTSRLRLVCTLRADFYDRPLLHPDFGELLRTGTEVITPMSPTGLEHAIAGPAHRVGVEVDQALVAEIVADVVERPAALPLMQYALTEMFDLRKRNVIATGAYHQVGGVLGALVQRAEGIYATLDEESRLATRQVFLRLVSMGDQGELDTRRRALVAELTSLGAWGESVRTVLDLYGHHRLLTFDRDVVTRGPTVEISHEALLTEWERLHSWIDDARNDMKLQRRLATAMREWEESDRADDYLLGAGLLHQLADWSANTVVSLTESEKVFLDASIDREAAALEEERKRADEHDAAVRRSRRRTTMLVAVGGIAVVVALLAIFAWQQRREASDLADAATRSEYAARLASHALRQSGSDPELSMLLALRAADASVDLEYLPIPVEEAMHMAFQAARLVYPGDVEFVQSALTPSGTRGYYVLAPDELATSMGEELQRGFSVDECARFDIAPCPAGTDDLVRVDRLPPLFPREPGTLAGTEVAITHSFLMGEGFPDELAAFQERSGIGIVDMSSVASIMVGRESFDRPLPIDVQVAPQPAIVHELDRDFEMVDLSVYLDRRQLDDVYQPYLLSLVSDQSRLLAIPVNADLKGLVWYGRDRFERLGLASPDSWAELLSLSRTIVAAGEVPWCLAFSDGGSADGWPGTDWIEAMVVRDEGPETYDAWVSHGIPFDDPSIIRAFGNLEAILSSDGFVEFGRENVSVLPWWTTFSLMFPDDGAGCWMLLGSTFVDQARIGETEMSFFLVPPTRGSSSAATGSGNFAAAFADRPEIRELMRFISSREYGRRWASGIGFLSPRQDFDPGMYGPEGDWFADAKRKAASIMLEALIADEWRFDGSDLMPGPIGSFTEEGGNGAFFTTMIGFADGALTPRGAAARVEEAWRAIEAAER